MNRRYIVLISLLSYAYYTAVQANPKFDSVIQEHIKLLRNLDTANPPLMLLFSATPGMGKTTVATKIQDALHAVKITVDDARRLLIKQDMPVQGDTTYRFLPIEDKIACVVRYLDQLIQAIRKASKNQFIIIDDSVNQWYDQIKGIAGKHSMPTFLIRLDVSKATAITRIKQREHDPQEYLDAMDRWYRFYEQFDTKNIDYIFCNEKNRFDDQQFDELLSALKLTISTATIHRTT